ncbi:unnamed protein product [Nippostrongylus brasiliensis]|uniref:Uncharacterized protein n=1 Tax=Nippostrongylus brasiliensis TaxID=27835 RepID=A0A0N4XWK0_NIPBR|nr:unnamed protein product [Nippostrongylus brasiliensis]
MKDHEKNELEKAKRPSHNISDGHLGVLVSVTYENRSDPSINQLARTTSTEELRNAGGLLSTLLGYAPIKRYLASRSQAESQKGGLLKRSEATRHKAAANWFTVVAVRAAHPPPPSRHPKPAPKRSRRQQQQQVDIELHQRGCCKLIGWALASDWGN